MEDAGDGIEANTCDEPHHDAHRDSIQHLRCLVIAKPQELWKREGSTLRIDGHNEESDKYHGWDRPNPVKMQSHGAVLRARGNHSDYLKCPTVCRKKGKGRYGSRQCMPRMKELRQSPEPSQQPR